MACFYVKVLGSYARNDTRSTLKHAHSLKLTIPGSASASSSAGNSGKLGPIVYDSIVALSSAVQLYLLEEAGPAHHSSAYQP